jgi:hypothetical protein
MIESKLQIKRYNVHSFVRKSTMTQFIDEFVIAQITSLLQKIDDNINRAYDGACRIMGDVRDYGTHARLRLFVLV